MPLKPHPTDPDKMVYVSRTYALSPREWRGLTDKEFEEIIMSDPNAHVPVLLWQLIQDKLREKNT